MLRERLHDLWLRLKAVFKRRQLDRDLAEELEFHLAMREQKLIEQGMSPREAHYAARRGFGNVSLLKETNREMWGFPSLESWLQDVRYGLRQLRRSPGFTALAVLTLALGIGGTTAMFSVVYCAFLNPFPYADSHRLVGVFPWDKKLGEGHEGESISEAEIRDYQAQARVFDKVAGATWEHALLTGTGAPEDWFGSHVTGTYFGLLGVPPFIGRTINPEDTIPEAPPVAVLSHKAWLSTFGGNPQCRWPKHRSERPTYNGHRGDALPLRRWNNECLVFRNPLQS